MNSITLFFASNEDLEIGSMFDFYVDNGSPLAAGIKEAADIWAENTFCNWDSSCDELVRKLPTKVEDEFTYVEVNVYSFEMSLKEVATCFNDSDSVISGKITSCVKQWALADDNGNVAKELSIRILLS